MPSHIGWGEIGERLLFTVIAGTLVGINRGEHGRPAGLRTTLLVCLAAAVSMIQVNLLLPIRGKAADSYVVMDLMRLPLGILSGMGFIGAGAILRKDNVVLGVTTAATLWFVTVLGLCFGGGQIELGCAALGLGLIVLWALKPVEKLWKHQRQGTLTVVVGNAGPTEQEITESLINGGYHVYSTAPGLVERYVRPRAEGAAFSGRGEGYNPDAYTFPDEELRQREDYGSVRRNPIRSPPRNDSGL